MTGSWTSTAWGFSRRESWVSTRPMTSRMSAMRSGRDGNAFFEDGTASVAVRASRLLAGRLEGNGSAPVLGCSTATRALQSVEKQRIKGLAATRSLRSGARPALTQHALRSEDYASRLTHGTTDYETSLDAG